MPPVSVRCGPSRTSPSCRRRSSSRMCRWRPRASGASVSTGPLTYPLFDQARRISAGQSIADHAQEIGRLWSSFSRVAAGNPHAWVRKEYGPDELITRRPVTG